MAIPTIIIGALLILVGIFGYIMGTPLPGAESVSKTAFIPSYFGIALVILGAIGTKVKGKGHMHVMHVAVLVGILGLVGSAMRIPKSVAKVNEGGDALALYAQASMALLCLAYVALCVRSFIIARRNRDKEASAAE